MTAVVWMLATWLPQVFSLMTELPAPVNMTLSSHNFIHLLSWQPGHSTPPGVQYNVSVYSQTATSWEPVSGCQLVEPPLRCNLTRALGDPHQWYYSRVTALLGARTSHATRERVFTPITDTLLELPLLSVAPCDGVLCVGLQPPLEHLRKIYQTFQYELRVTSDTAKFSVRTRSLDGEVLRNLAPGRRYCVSVRFSDHLVNRTSGYGRPHCAAPAAAGLQATADAAIPSVLCVLLVLALMGLGLLVRTGVVCLREPLPQILTSIHHLETGGVLCEADPLCSLVLLEPPAGNKGNSEAPEADSGEESDEDSSVGVGGGYKVTANPLVPSNTSSSSSSSSSAATSSCSADSGMPLLLHHHSGSRAARLLPGRSSYERHHPSKPLPGACTSAAIATAVRPKPNSAAVSALNLLPASVVLPRSVTSTWDQHAVSEGQTRPRPPRLEPLEPLIATGVGPKVETLEHEQLWGDVNLLSLTFAGSEDDEARSLNSGPAGVKSPYESNPPLPTQTGHAEEVATSSISTPELSSSSSSSLLEEDEDEEDYAGGYLQR